MATCDRCSGPVPNGLPDSGGGARSRGGFRKKVYAFEYVVRFNYAKFRSLLDSPRAVDRLESSIYTEVTLCPSCWEAFFNFLRSK